MRPEPDEIAALVQRLVSGPWPTDEHERVDWFHQHGLPGDARPVPDRDDRTSHGARFEADGPPGWGATEWRFFDGAFVGLCWFFWFDLSDAQTRAAADSLRGSFNMAWPPVEQLEDPVQGFTSLWTAGECQIDMYFHASRSLSNKHSAPSGVQLHVDHIDRAAVEEGFAVRHPAAPPAGWAPPTTGGTGRLPRTPWPTSNPLTATRWVDPKHPLLPRAGRTPGSAQWERRADKGYVALRRKVHPLRHYRRR